MTVRKYVQTYPVASVGNALGCAGMLSILAYGFGAERLYWLAVGGIGSVLSIGLVALVISLS